MLHCAVCSLVWFSLVLSCVCMSVLSRIFLDKFCNSVDVLITVLSACHTFMRDCDVTLMQVMTINSKF